LGLFLRNLILRMNSELCKIPNHFFLNKFCKVWFCFVKNELWVLQILNLFCSWPNLQILQMLGLCLWKNEFCRINSEFYKFWTSFVLWPIL
jgi:hypothetical protein